MLPDYRCGQIRRHEDVIELVGLCAVITGPLLDLLEAPFHRFASVLTEQEIQKPSYQRLDAAARGNSAVFKFTGADLTVNSEARGFLPPTFAGFSLN